MSNQISKGVHDLTFKMALSNPKLAKSLIESYIPKNILELIDLDSVRAEKNSFIDDELKEHFADLLFSLNFKANDRQGFLYVLAEHKSSKDNHVLLQILRYMLKLWDRSYKKNNSTKLPRILPVIVYHGKTKWEIPNRLAQMFDDLSELDCYLPDFGAQILNLQQLHDDQLKGIDDLKIAFWFLKHIFDTDLLDQISKVENFIDSWTLPDKVYIIDLMLTYVTSVKKLSKEEIFSKIRTEFEQGEKAVELLSEQFRKEGMAQGMEQGELKGMTAGVLYGIELELEMKFGKDAAALMNQVRQINDPEKLKNILSAIKIAESFDSVKQIIR